MSAIDDLRNKVIRLVDELKTAREKLASACVEAASTKVGDLLKDKHGRLGTVVNVTANYDGSNVIVRVALHKKDGQIGARTKIAYSWEKWEKVP